MIRLATCGRDAARMMHRAMSIAVAGVMMNPATSVRDAVRMMLLAMSAAVAVPTMPPAMTVVVVADVVRMTCRGPTEPSGHKAIPAGFATSSGLFS